MVTKQAYYDSRSLRPERGDRVRVLIWHHDRADEWLEAVYVGAYQLESYTTPYFIFLDGDEVRMVHSNAVREWRYILVKPGDSPLLLESEQEKMPF